MLNLWENRETNSHFSAITKMIFPPWWEEKRIE